MKTYELTFDDQGNEKGKGCYRVSIVKGSAVETILTKFGKDDDDQSPVFFANDEKRVIYCVAMRPNKMIFRKDVYGKPANVFYTPETVEKVLQSYFKQGGNLATNIDHKDENVNGVYPFEAWIVRDEGAYTKDCIGLETKKGDAVMAFKIEDDAVWEDCKNGNLDGLSIEAFFGYKETNINFNKEPEMNWKAIFKTLFGADAVEIAPGYWAKDKEVGTVVLDKDGNPAASAEMEIDGKKVKTDADGKILKEEEMEGDEMTLDEAKARITELEGELAAEKEKNTKSEADKTKAETELQTMSSQKTTADTSLQTMTTERDTEKARADKAEADLLAFKKTNTPAKRVDFKNDKGEAIEYEDMTPFQQMMFNKEQRG